MSCADVCLDHGYCDDYPELFTADMVRAVGTHRCEECLRIIEHHEHHERVKGKWYGVFLEYRTCAECCEIRDVFVCGTKVIGGLWESIREEMFPIWNERGPIDCLAKIESRAARDLLRVKYREWQGENEC